MLSILSNMPIMPEDIHCYITLKQSQQVIAVAVLGQNPYHPYCDECYIYVVPEKRRQGIASKLLQHILYHATQPLKISIYSHQKSAQAFLIKNGFICLRHNWEFEVTKDHLNFSPYKNSLCLRSFEQATDTQLRHLHELIVEDYRLKHESVSPANYTISTKQWQTILLENMSLKHSFFYERDSKFSYVISFETDDNIELAYIGGSVDSFIFDAFCQEILSHYTMQFEQVSLEIDSTDPHAMRLTSFVNLPLPESYVAYIKIT